MKTFEMVAKDGSRIKVTKDGSSLGGSCTCPVASAGELCHHLIRVLAADSTVALLAKESHAVEFELFDVVPDSLRDLAGEMIGALEDLDAAKAQLAKTNAKLRKELKMPPPLPK